MTRGFITLAVGKDSYYRLAYNLLHSYKKTTPIDAQLPWAIVCDRENEWTTCFDQIIILENPSLSYMDKLKAFSLCPYDECIFIDADCLLFYDISIFWQHMKSVNGFSCFGRALPLNSQDGWFLIDDIGEWRDKISFIPQMHGGICFMKRGDTLNRILYLAEYVKKHYSEFRFKYFDEPADEPILALAMAIIGSKPITASSEYFVFLPTVDKIRIREYLTDPTRILVEKNNANYEVFLIHFQNRNTEKAAYKVICDVIFSGRVYSEYLFWLAYTLLDFVRPYYRRLSNLFHNKR